MILQNYASQISKTDLNGATVPYTYGSGSSSLASVSGVIGMKMQDLDGDGMQELLVISINGGRLMFDIYKVFGENVEQVISQVAVCDGMERALEEFPCGTTQECFLINNGSGFDIGIAAYRFGVDKGDGTPAARTSVEIYHIDGDITCSLIAAVTIENGSLVYMNNDRESGSEGGAELFGSNLMAAGLNGDWIYENAKALTSMDLFNNPRQDMSDIPDPLESGLASKAEGVQDVVLLSGSMSAGSGNINIRISDYTTLAEYEQKTNQDTGKAGSENSNSVQIPEGEAMPEMAEIPDTTEESIIYYEEDEGGTENGEKQPIDSAVAAIPEATEDGTYVPEEQPGDSSGESGMIIYEENETEMQNAEEQPQEITGGCM